ncbi:hypothetical protein PG994_014451 [Apiospora phragmitis]|uniref:Uncharacterized protein n=1 Tax=Apiospora phragmitis TaxID=2905665 RepID=A0ABR1T4E1_9PEZI
MVATPPLLPRKLLLEVLDSLQRVLFPLDDAASKRLLRRLIKSPDTAFRPFEYSSLHGQSTEAREKVDKDDGTREYNANTNTGGGGGLHYRDLAARLAELQEELENSSPRRWFDRELQRRSSARHVMMVTLAGVVFAVLSLCMSAIQTWIAYQAWKAPTNPSPA